MKAIHCGCDVSASSYEGQCFKQCCVLLLYHSWLLILTVELLRHWLVITQVGSGRIVKVKRWSTEWRAQSRWIFVCSVCSTVRCQRPATRTTTVPVTRRASLTHTTLHSSPTRPTLSPTAPGTGGVRSSVMSSKPSCWHWAAAACSCSVFQSNLSIIQARLLLTYNNCFWKYEHWA